MRARPSIRKPLLLVLGVLALVVVALNWTYGRLPATPRPTGSFIQVEGLRIHYIERPGTGTPIVLLHGLPGTAEDFDEVTPLLAGHRTIAIDRPGFGYSTGGYVPFARQLQTIQALLGKLHIAQAIFVGHSYGGAMALAFAELHPQEVRGLVLVDAAATCTRNTTYERAQARLVRVLQTPVIRQIANATFSQLLLKVSADQGDGQAFDPAAVDPTHRRRVLAINMKHENLEAWAGETLEANGVIEGINRSLAQIRLPAVVIQGASDKLVKPACGRRLAALLPQSRLVMVSGGHMAPYTHPGSIAAAIESLS
jgi:pimeloyl-ACP methyl ester carboxylesterase